SDGREDNMKSLVVKRSIMIGGRRSSVSVEEAFWNGLKEIASTCRLSLSELVDRIDARRQHSNLSSAIRLFVLDHYRIKIGAAADTPRSDAEEVQVPGREADASRPNEPI